MHPKTFEKQIDFLISKGFQLVTLSQLDTASEDSDKRIAICFDDGYKNVIDYAYPVLKKYSAAATVFIITDFIGRKNTWDVNLAGIQYEHLSKENIQKLVDAGWEIGSHSVSHRSLRGGSEQELNYQLSHSKRTLEKMVSQPVHYFTPPFGNVSPRIHSAAMKHGYLNVCGFFPIKYYKTVVPKGMVLRLAVYRTDSLKSLERKLSGDKRMYFEVMKQNVINFCSNGTIAVNSLR
ncbi:MAG: polysaccharide deacetylase family protein [Candidatus Marinimicrobia bacterium]|nr:polysaccharide deacetylase family protein [Candidatus Neomarinimicrobiota bacterium]